MVLVDLLSVFLKIFGSNILTYDKRDLIGQTDRFKIVFGYFLSYKDNMGFHL